MDSSQSDRDNSSPQNNPEPKAHNPFIQFRQFADAQIGVLLQGIIGLPSAFSKRQSGDIRWTDIDDGQRRRDEVQASQRQLGHSEVPRQSYEAETGMNSTISEEWNSYSMHGSRGSVDQNNVEGKSSMDLPLYSPVTKSLFAHLRRGFEDETEWKKLDSRLEHRDGLSKFSSLVQILQLLFDTSGDPLKRTQNIMYESINAAADLRSDYSLLPYLLFSSYSPLALGQSSIDKFPYKDAFEDLLQTSQNNGMVVKCQNDYPTEKSLSETEHKKRLIEPRKEKSKEGYHSIAIGEDHSTSRDYWTMFRHPETHNQTRVTVNRIPRDRESTGNIVADLLWIKKLDQIGLLQPGQVSRTFGALSNTHYFPANRSLISELEMYDHFLDWASSPATVSEAVRAREDLSLVKGEVGPPGTQSHNDIPHISPLGIMREILEAVRKVPVTPNASAQPAGSQIQPVLVPEKAPESFDRVVSTSTTSMRTVNEDGSIETSTTVWKRFSSGRETSTTTRQCEDTASSENSFQHPGIEENHLDDVKNEKASRKSGWFWN